MLSPIVVFYGTLVIFTLLQAAAALPIRVPGKRLEETTVYQLTDRLSWVGGGIILGLLPLVWKWPIHSYVGAILVPLIGDVMAASLVMSILGEVLDAETRGKLFRRLVTMMIFYAIVIIVVWFIWILVAR